jgi:hypothetical protein
MIVSDEI